MEQNEYRLYAPNLICINVDTVREGDCAGKIWHQYEDEAVKFNNTMRLVREMDKLYDEWDFPQKATSLRNFKNRECCTEADNKKEAGPQMDARRIQDKKGDKGTFIVHVKYRQNATWQGEVVWVEQKKRQYFRSALELLKLIDSALDEEAEAPQEENWGN